MNILSTYLITLTQAWKREQGPMVTIALMDLGQTGFRAW